MDHQDPDPRVTPSCWAFPWNERRKRRGGEREAESVRRRHSTFPTGCRLGPHFLSLAQKTAAGRTRLFQMLLGSLCLWRSA